MSETPTPVAEKPAESSKEPAEKPFNVDILQSCTARFTYKAWHLYSEYKKDLNLIQTVPVRCQLTAHSAEGAQTLYKLLTEAGVKELTLNQAIIDFTATFAQVQQVIKQPETQMLDAVKI